MHCGDQRHLGLCLGYVPALAYGSCRVSDQGTTLLASDLHNARASILNPFNSRDPHPPIKLWCQVPFTKSKTIFQIEMYCMQCFWKANILKVEHSMTKIDERRLWSLRSCFLILPPGALTPQGIEGAMKRDVSRHWCTLQSCASRGWVIVHENWTSCVFVQRVLTYVTFKLF